VKRIGLWLAVGLLMIIVFNRFLVVGDVVMDHDEVRSISRTIGTPLQIIEWQPRDWPPLYYLVLGAYRVTVGMHPLFLRIFSILWFALSLAGMYRLSLSISSQQKAALLSMAAYASFGLIQFQSTHVRGYIMAMALFPLAFWLAIRLFEREKSRWSDVILLAVALAVLFYTTYSAVFAFLILGLYTLLTFPLIRIWRWLRVGLVAIVLALPMILSLASHILPTLAARETARAGGQTFELEPYPQYQWQLLESYAGTALPLWIGLVIIFLGIFIWKRSSIQRSTFALLVLSLLSPIFAGLVMPFFGLAAPHYSWWAVFPIALLAGNLLSDLPNYFWQIAAVIMIAFPFLPIPVDTFDLRYGNQFLTPFESTFEWLQDHMNPGDVILVDSSCDDIYEKCGTAEEWEYFQRVYFPDRRLNIVRDIEETSDARRIWYLHIDGWHDEALEAQVAEGRMESIFVGPWDFLWQLYEAPPDPEGVLYQNGMRFHGFDVIDPALGNGYTSGSVVRREGESVILRLWWSVDEVLEQDYSISTGIAPAMNQPALVQVDSAPQTIALQAYGDVPPPETSQWVPGEMYVEERVLELTADIDADLRDSPLVIFMTVYQWWDGETISAPEVHETGRRRLREMFVLAY